jgi:hypothetical protein
MVGVVMGEESPAQVSPKHAGPAVPGKVIADTSWKTFIFAVSTDADDAFDVSPFQVDVLAPFEEYVHTIDRKISRVDRVVEPR